MSIIIQISPSQLTSSSSVAPHPACIVEAETTLDMGPDLEYDTEAPVTTEDNSTISVSTVVTATHGRKEVRTSTHLSQGFASCFGLPYQDHNYGAPPPPSPPQSPLPKVNGTTDDDTSFSVISTSTNNEEDTQEESITRCICGFDHDDEYMICCDRCSVWQHVDCMGLNQNNIPETYLCEKCEPRKVDRQKAKALQTRKKEAMTDSTTDESGDEENSVSHSSVQTGITQNDRISKLRKRRKDRRGVNKSDSGGIMKKYKTLKGNKERVERTKTGIRKKTKSESTSTADEEAQDAWDSSIGEWALKYEEAFVNQYTPEVQLLAGSLVNHNNEMIKKILEQLRNQLCKVVDYSSKKRLIATMDIAFDQVIVEYKGKFLSTSQFYEQNPVFNKRSYPFVLFFKVEKHSDICIDAREYGNEARFVRRSCLPNAEVRSVVNNGLLYVYLFSSKEIKKDEEITIPFDLSYMECVRDLDCACGKEDCSINSLHRKNGLKDISASEKKKKGKRFPEIENNDNQSSVVGNTIISNSPCKIQKNSPIKNIYQSTPISHTVSSPADTTLDSNKMNQEEHEQDEQTCRKMTREERKIDAIMRAFERMEKTAKRRQQALERMAQQKAQQQKQEVEKDSSDILFMKSESNIGDDESSNLQSSGDATCNDDPKTSLVTACPNNSVNNCRHKKGKRRRGSGTPARRRTRSNSGGSDIMSPDELPTLGINPVIITSAISPSNIVTSISTTTCTTITSNAISNNSAFPKTKKFLMQEWLQEKAETSVPVSCPLTIHTELSWNLSTASPTCYVRCTRDSPNVGGISSAHLRRNSTSCIGQGGKSSSSLGSAKKRWLRQAMFESGTSEIECANFETTVLDGGQNSPLHNGCFSPNPHSDASSPCVSPPGDIVTPLKKRRLMRESLESLPSPRSLSPNAPSGWPASLSSIESPDHSNSALEMSFPMLSGEEKIVQIENVVEDYDETSTVQNNLNGLELHLVSAAKELREHWIAKNENSDMEPTSSSGLNQDINLNEEKITSPNVSDIPSGNINTTDSSQDSSCLDLTCHDERESHVSSSESMVPINRTEDDIIDTQTVGNVSSSTVCDSNEVTSTNKELSPAEDNKDSLPDSSLSGDIELGNRISESDICFVQQEQFTVESNCVQDCVTSSHIVNNITTTDKHESSHIVNIATLCLSVENAQNVQLPVTTTAVSSLPSLNSNSVNVPQYTSVVSSSVSYYDAWWRKI